MLSQAMVRGGLLHLLTEKPLVLDGLENLVDVTAVAMSGTGANDEQLLRIVTQFPNLQEIRLASTQVTDVGIAHLAGMPELNELNLNFLEQLTDACVDSLLKIPNLTKVSLQGARVSHEARTRLEREHPAEIEVSGHVKTD